MAKTAIARWSGFEPMQAPGRWRWAEAVKLLLSASLLATSALAADYPVKPITIIVPYPPGGSSDIQARLVAKGLAERLGQPVLVDNRPGAGGRIGVSLAARAAPDGYTLLFASLSPFAIEPVVRSNVGYDPQRDFVLISMLVEMPFLLVVSSDSPARSLPELIALGRKQPGGLTYASWGAGSAGHLLTEMLKRAAQIDAVHVPYKGEAPALLDILGGRVSMMFVTTVAAMPHIQSGKLRALAATSTRRLPMLPAVPTMAQSGFDGIDLQLWSSLAAPAKTPPEIVARLERETAAVLRSAEVARFAQSQAASPIPAPGREVTQRIRTDSEAVRQLMSAVKLNLEE
jgi:tripartite-type tricarboxylate transporter receptor subunit TctC